MPTRLTLICHGATAATRAAAFPRDEPIEARAADQAAALRHTLHRPDRIWTSPALRALQTAAALGLDATPDPLLRDCDYGRWSGRHLHELEIEEPGNIAAWLSDLEAAPHGGESIAALLQRVATWLDRRKGDGDHGIVVTHAAVIRAAVLHAIAAPATSFRHIDVGPLSLTDLRSDGTRWTWRAPTLTLVE